MFYKITTLPMIFKGPKFDGIWKICLNDGLDKFGQFEFGRHFFNFKGSNYSG